MGNTWDPRSWTLGYLGVEGEAGDATGSSEDSLGRGRVLEGVETEHSPAPRPGAPLACERDKDDKREEKNKKNKNGNEELEQE